MISEIAEFMVKHPSSIREIMELVAEYERHPEKFPRPLIYLAGGWPQDSPPDVIKEAFFEALQDENLWKRGARYSPTIGYPDFIEAITNYERNIFGRKIDPSNIIVGLGSTEQTAAIFKLLLNPNDSIILTQPGYLNYTRQIELELQRQAKIRYWRTINSEGKFDPSLDELNNLIDKNTKILLISSPGNPDGQVWSDTLLRAIHDLAEDHDFYIVIDAAYRAFIFSGDKNPYSRSPLPREIWICSFSKELRAPGWRISYVVLPEELKQPFNTIEQAKVLAPVSIIQVVLTRLFTNNNMLRKLYDFYDKGAKKYAEVANYTVALLNEIDDLITLHPNGGFYVFFNITRYADDDKKVWRELIDQKQVALAPGSDFNEAKGWLRLSFAPIIETPEVLTEGIKRLKEYFEELRGK